MHPRCCPTVVWMRWNYSSTSFRLPAGNVVGALYHKLQTQYSAPEDGRNYRTKHVELIGIINKPLLLHLVGCLYYYISQYFLFIWYSHLHVSTHMCHPQRVSKILYFAKLHKFLQLKLFTLQLHNLIRLNYYLVFAEWYNMDLWRYSFLWKQCV